MSRRDKCSAEIWMTYWPLSLSGVSATSQKPQRIVSAPSPVMNTTDERTTYFYTTSITV